MECQSSLDPAVLSGFTGIPDADLQNFLDLDLPDIDFDAYLNLDHAGKDTNMRDFDGRLSLPGPAPLLSGERYREKSVIDPLPASYAWTNVNIGKPQYPAKEQLTAPQAMMSEYQTMQPWTQSHAPALQPIPGIIYDSQGCVISPSKGYKGEFSRWVPCSPPPQLLNTQVGSQFTLINAGDYLPGHQGKQILSFAKGHLPSSAPQMGDPTLTQNVRGSDLNAANGFQRQVNTLPLASSHEADRKYPVPKVVAANHQPNSESSTQSRTTKTPTKPRLRKPLLLTKPNPRYTTQPK